MALFLHRKGLGRLLAGGDPDLELGEGRWPEVVGGQGAMFVFSVVLFLLKASPLSQ